MPKYVFEVSITLPAGDDLTVSQLNGITNQLQDRLADVAASFGKRRGHISHDDPFEQVTGDWLPADDNGVIRPSAESRHIDYEP